jgi:iron uptake system component EfeO
MKELIGQQLQRWLAATRKLQAAAPEPSDRGWDKQLDAESINQMKAHWLEGRGAYELIEGAIAPTFPESDAAADARYDDFLGLLGGTGDHQPFDDKGIVGMHAIERILWADSIPDIVVTFERGIPGYKPAAQPANAEEAKDFKHKLVVHLATDIETLKRQFSTVELDIAFAFRGLIDLAVEQAEKVDLAATGQEESRYAQTTMRDLRANYQGCLDAYALFKPWLANRPDGVAIDAKVSAAFERLRVAYAAVPGDAIPRPPTTWSSLEPSAADAESSFGKLFLAVSAETDDAKPGSLHHSLIRVADALGLPKRVTQ